MNITQAQLSWATIFAAMASIGSFLAAVLSWLAVRRANTVAAAVGQIERDRWHNEIAPRLRITTDTFGGTDGFGWLRLNLHLDGPVGLDQLDAVTVRVRDDRPGRKPVTAGDPTQEQIDNTIWGPLRFNPQIDGIDRLGRRAEPQPLELGEALHFQLEKTLHPEWVQHDTWRLDYHAGERWRLRLAITCEKAGYKPWYVPADIDIDPDPKNPLVEMRLC